MAHFLNVGDWVEWESQSAGSWTQKKGKVVAVVPANTAFWQWAQRNANAVALGKYTQMFDGGIGKRKEVSYLVAVESETGRAKPKLYWPRTSALRIQVGEDSPGVVPQE